MYLETIQWELNNRSYGSFQLATKMAFRYTLIYPEFGFYVKNKGDVIFNIEAVRRKKTLKKKKRIS